ncbi:unnamed protein product [Nesidiocoris tenuis]|uniref:Uncharacterized protein n=1 Tax=Nesidiocoris tenuis TaxID=355587 RepID=A0A6H5H4B0_9HEMI|nr:unnamed protein product [Nesidiocoris tenuis]
MFNNSPLRMKCAFTTGFALERYREDRSFCGDSNEWKTNFVARSDMINHNGLIDAPWRSRIIFIMARSAYTKPHTFSYIIVVQRGDKNTVSVPKIT